MHHLSRNPVTFHLHPSPMPARGSSDQLQHRYGTPSVPHSYPGNPPLWFSDIVHGTITNDMEEDVNHTVDSPAEQAEIVAVGTKNCGVVSTVSVVAVNAIHVLDV